MSRSARVSAPLLAAIVLSLAGADEAAPRVTPVTGPALASMVRNADPDRGGDPAAVLVNVWATWCAPCLEELPDVLRLRRTYRDSGLRVLLVSGDFADQTPSVERFLARFGVDFETYIKDGPDMEFIDGLHPEWSGAMPATMVYDGAGRLVRFKEGKATYEELEAWVRDALDARGPTGRAEETP